MLVKGAVQQEVFDCLNRDALAVWADQRVRLANAEEMVVKTNVPHSELKNNGCLSTIEISYQPQVLLRRWKMLGAISSVTKHTFSMRATTSPSVSPKKKKGQWTDSHNSGQGQTSRLDEVLQTELKGEIR